MGVSKNDGTSKSSILIGFPIINHPFWGTPIFGNIHMCFAETGHLMPSRSKKGSALPARNGHVPTGKAIMAKGPMVSGQG